MAEWSEAKKNTEIITRLATKNLNFGASNTWGQGGGPGPRGPPLDPHLIMQRQIVSGLISAMAVYLNWCWSLASVIWGSPHHQISFLEAPGIFWIWHSAAGSRCLSAFTRKQICMMPCSTRLAQGQTGGNMATVLSVRDDAWNRKRSD